MATLEELVVRIRADATQLERGLSQATATTQRSAARMQSSLEGVARAAGSLTGTISTGLVINWAKQAVDAAGRINDLSKQIDFATSSLANLDVLLVQNGTSLEQLSAAANILNANIGAAADGNEELIKKFDALGLSVTKLKQIGPEQAFYAVTEAIHGLNDASKEADIGRDLLGRGYRNLVPTLDQVNGKLGEHIDQLNALNGKVLTESIEKLDQLGDVFAAFWTGKRNDFIVGLAFTIDKLERLVGLASAIPRIPGINKGNATDIIGGIAGGFGIGSVRNDIPLPAGPPGTSITVTPKRSRAAGTNTHLLKEQTKARKELTEAERDAARIIEVTRTAQEKYDAELGKATKLWLDGGINLDTLNRYQKELEAELTKANEALDENAKRLEVVAKIIKDHIGDALESALFDAKSFGDGFTKIVDGIARQIARTAFIDPLSSSIGDFIKESGVTNIFSTLFGGKRAAGGPVSAGSAYLVGEKGPEIFTPGSSGGITPNNRIGGQQIHVTQVINVQTGVAQTVRAEMMNLLPQFRASAIDGMFQQLQSGGAASRLIGART